MSSNTEIRKFIDKQNSLSTLSYITCGSVDDGKSTLLGRMLYEAQLIFDDQVKSLVKDSKKSGTQGEDIDFALLVDGLSAEREQGITIDVAYRFFSTEKRKFIVADSPGHEQYTRNMVTAASNAEVAIILIDSRNGIMPQTKRHSFIANLVGIKNVIIAINKMDLVGYDEEIFLEIKKDFQNEISSKLDFEEVIFIPVSAIYGDNIIKSSLNMSWYKGKPLMEVLENIKIKSSVDHLFSMPIQYVNRPDISFRGYSGTISSGELCPGDSIIVSKSNQKASVEKIYLGDTEVSKCSIGDSITITLNKEIDISRGDLLLDSKYPNTKNNSYLANLIWFNENECYQNRSFLLKNANNQVSCEIIKIKNKININSYEKNRSGSLAMNDIAECEILLDHDLFLEPYTKNKTLGNFILVDRKSNLTVASGMIKHSLRRTSNIKWQGTDISREIRQDLINQKSFVIWFTGLSGAGKSTIANIVEKKLSSEGKLTYLLDGDNLRHGLNKDLGFKKEDRIENLRRVGEVTKILHDTGVIVLASFISPYRKDRKKIKELIPKGDFIEVFVDAPIETLEKRDPKGLYAKAKKGEIPNFTGLGSEYEPPSKPDIHINSKNLKPEESADLILKYLKNNNVI